MDKLDRRILQDNQDYLAYKEAREESFAVADAVLERQHELRTLAAKQELLVTNLTNDPDKKKAVSLLRNILRKRREKVELTRQCALSVEEEKQQLIKQVRMARSDIEAL
uniref:Uncharacterized protein n=1 Tax=Lygus hesperus TaxID=30085 RepID=A0A146KYK0_LYGHE